MPVKLIQDGEMIMGKPRTALNLNKGSEFKGAIEGLKLGESVRQARVRQALDERQMGLREGEAQRQQAIDLEGQKNSEVERKYKGIVTNKIAQDVKAQEELRKQEELGRLDIPSLIVNDMDGFDKRRNIENQNKYFASLGVSPDYHIADMNTDENGNYSITYKNGTKKDIPKAKIDAMIAHHFPKRSAMIIAQNKAQSEANKIQSNEKIKLQSEEAKKQKEALKNASGIADLPSAGYDVSAFEYTDDKNNKQRDYKGMKYFDEVYRKNLATMGDSKKALEATAQALRIPSFQSQLDAVKKDKTLSPEAKITARQEILAKMGQNQSPMVPMNTQAQAPAPQTPAVKQIVRTGRTADGRKVVQYSDGTREYQNDVAPITANPTVATTASPNIQAPAIQTPVRPQPIQPMTATLPTITESQVAERPASKLKYALAPDPLPKGGIRGLDPYYNEKLSKLQKQLKNASPAEQSAIADAIIELKQSKLNAMNQPRQAVNYDTSSRDLMRSVGRGIVNARDAIYAIPSPFVE